MTGGLGHILVVEDEPLLLEIVASEIEEEGFSVIRADTAEAALEILQGPVDLRLMFTDIRLPGAMNGWRLAERAHEIRENLPVIFATGYSEESPTNVARSRFFQKPYRIAEVVSTIRDIIQS